MLQIIGCWISTLKAIFKVCRKAWLNSRDRLPLAIASLEGWRFSLQAPSYIPFMMFCENRALRQKMYEAYVTRASDQGPDAGQFDNDPLMVRILRLRAEMASLLGFANYAQYALEGRMAGSAEEISNFLRTLADCAKAAGAKEPESLRQFALQEYGEEDLEAWDIAFYSEKLKQSLYSFSDEAIRPYFPLPRKVLEGLFFVARKLFGVTVRKLRQSPGTRMSSTLNY